MEGAPRIRHIALDVQPDFALCRIRYACTLKAEGRGPCRLALNRGLRVLGIAGEGGAPLDFTQELRPVWDNGRAEALFVEVGTLPGVFSLKVEGCILPYSDRWAYVRDTVNDNCTLLREDAFAYPMLLEGGGEVPAVLRADVEYDVVARMPVGMTAICGGWPVDVSQGEDGTTYRFRSERPTFRFDIVMGRYAMLEDARRGLRLFLLEDSPSRGQGGRVLRQAADCALLFEGLLGKMGEARRLAAIEIPEGYGGQAGDGYFLQQSYAFCDPRAIDGIYHEIAHGWTTARAAGEAKGKRFFDEAIASYLQVLALRRLHGEEAAQARLERMRQEVGKALLACGDPALTTLAHHGHTHRLAYNKGAWMLAELARRMGEANFLAALRDFIHAYDGAPADFADFRRVVQARCEESLDVFFDAWLYGGRTTLDLLRGSF